MSGRGFFSLDKTQRVVTIFYDRLTGRAKEIHNEIMLQNFLNELKFSLREKYFGKFVFRAGVPDVSFNKEEIVKENQYYKMILSTGFSRPDFPQIGQVVDIGCRNWSYISALAEFFQKASLKGVELDGGRRYWNLYRRMDLTRAYGLALKLKEQREVDWVHSDFRELRKLQNNSPVAFCFFFPFVSQNPCLKWGLPARFACFKEILTHSIHLKRESGSPAVWISAHQGEWESEIAREVYQSVGLPWKEYILPVENFKDLWPSPFETRILVSTHDLTH